MSKHAPGCRAVRNFQLYANECTCGASKPALASPPVVAQEKEKPMPPAVLTEYELLYVLRAQEAEAQVTALQACVDQVKDVLDKHCRGFMSRPTTTENLPELIDRICTTSLQDVLAKQAAETALAQVQQIVSRVPRVVLFAEADQQALISWYNELRSALPKE